MTLPLKVTGKTILDYSFIAIGASIMSLGLGVFLVDAHVVPGGVSGLSMSIYYLSNNTIPIGIVMWLLNIPLFIWGLRQLGRSFGFRTFFAFTLNSFLIDFFRGDVPGFYFIKLQNHPAILELRHHDFMFMVLVGAALMGLGLGIIFKFRGTTGGSDIVASIMQKKYGIKPGQAIMLIDFFVITLAGFIIGLKNLSPDKHALVLTLYAFFLLIVSSKIIDIILDGFDYAKIAYIISDKFNEISDAVIIELGRGATAFKTRGVYKDIDREVIMTVVQFKEVGRLTEIVKKIDPDAFVIISNVHEVLGKGFGRRL